MSRPSEQDIQKIKDWDKGLEKEIPIRLVLTQGSGDQALEQFCDMLASHAPHVRITNKTETDKKMPEIQITDRISYSALPLERELAPFLEALSLSQESSPALPGELQEILEKITIPAQLKLWVAQACPHCPAMVQSIVPLALASDRVRLQVMDGTLFPKEAAKEKVLSAPCLILDEDFRWTGQISAREVIEMAATRDPSRLSAKSLRLILEEGQASWIADRMMEKKVLFPGFLDLLLHKLWSVRLGAMVVVETLAGDAPKLAEQMVAPLLEAYPNAEIPVKGDILYALGEIGNNKVAQELLELQKKTDHPDLLESLEDALTSIQERCES